MEILWQKHQRSLTGASVHQAELNMGIADLTLGELEATIQQAGLLSGFSPTAEFALSDLDTNEEINQDVASALIQMAMYGLITNFYNRDDLPVKLFASIQGQSETSFPRKNDLDYCRVKITVEPDETVTNFCLGQDPAIGELVVPDGLIQQSLQDAIRSFNIALEDIQNRDYS
jgi:hypothetical protein